MKNSIAKIACISLISIVLPGCFGAKVVMKETGEAIAKETGEKIVQFTTKETGEKIGYKGSQKALKTIGQKVGQETGQELTEKFVKETHDKIVLKIKKDLYKYNEYGEKEVKELANLISCHVLKAEIKGEEIDLEQLPKEYLDNKIKQYNKIVKLRSK